MLSAVPPPPHIFILHIPVPCKFLKSFCLHFSDLYRNAYSFITWPRISLKFRFWHNCWQLQYRALSRLFRLYNIVLLLTIPSLRTRKSAASSNFIIIHNYLIWHANLFSSESSAVSWTLQEVLLFWMSNERHFIHSTADQVPLSQSLQVFRP